MEYDSPPSNYVCFFCRKRGHFAAHCIFNDPDVSCQLCENIGHVALDCPLLFSMNTHAQVDIIHGKSTEASDEELVLVSVVNNPIDYQPTNEEDAEIFYEAIDEEEEVGMPVENNLVFNEATDEEHEDKLTSKNFMDSKSEIKQTQGFRLEEIDTTQDACKLFDERPHRQLVQTEIKNEFLETFLDKPSSLETEILRTDLRLEGLISNSSKNPTFTFEYCSSIPKSLDARNITMNLKMVFCSQNLASNFDKLAIRNDMNLRNEWVSLLAIQLSFANLTGSVVPTEIGQFFILQSLYLKILSLTGVLPSLIWNLCENLVFVKLHGNLLPEYQAEFALPNFTCTNLRFTDNKLAGCFSVDQFQELDLLLATYKSKTLFWTLSWSFDSLVKSITHIIGLKFSKILKNGVKLDFKCFFKDCLLSQYVKSEIADELLISCVSSCFKLREVIKDVEPAFSSQVYELSSLFLHKKLREGLHLTSILVPAAKTVMSRNIVFSDQVIELSFLYQSEGHEYRIAATIWNQLALILSIASVHIWLEVLSHFKVAWVDNGLDDRIPNSKAVLFTSFKSEYSENLRDVHWEHVTVSGQVVGISGEVVSVCLYQLSHEGFSQSRKPVHNRKAWTEMHSLGLTEVLVSSLWSTFGYVTQTQHDIRSSKHLLVINNYVDEKPHQTYMVKDYAISLMFEKSALSSTMKCSKISHMILEGKFASMGKSFTSLPAMVSSSSNTQHLGSIVESCMDDCLGWHDHKEALLQTLRCYPSTSSLRGCIGVGVKITHLKLIILVSF